MNPIQIGCRAKRKVNYTLSGVNSEMNQAESIRRQALPGRYLLVIFVTMDTTVLC